jgi:drug/metabolite transporter (DMT)-like permease
MVPSQFIAGVFAALIGYLVAGNLSISSHDLFLGFLAGTFQIGFGFIMITIGSQTTPAAVVGILMLTEAVFGPLWAWLFINEIPPISVIIGGSIIISAILFEFVFSSKKKE